MSKAIAAAQGAALSALQSVPWSVLCSAPTERLLHVALTACEELGRQWLLVEDCHVASSWLNEQASYRTNPLVYAECVPRLVQTCSLGILQYIATPGIKLPWDCVIMQSAGHGLEPLLINIVSAHGGQP